MTLRIDNDNKDEVGVEGKVTECEWVRQEEIKTETGSKRTPKIN